jgi:hypothetical protein
MEELIQYLITEGRGWIRSQRETLRPLGMPLQPQWKDLYSAYFDRETLKTVVVCVRPVIDNPPFYADLARRGMTIPFDFTQMNGITFSDTVVITQANSDPNGSAPLLFHECVHVVQYRKLGVDRFVEEYVRGWAENNYDYSSIPLEQEAYALQNRFSSGERFSVEAVVGG